MENAYAVVVGISAYHHINPLPATVLKDAEDMCGLLTDPQRCAYPSENVQLLLDDEATGVAVRQALERMAQECSSDSTALFYISSHGGRIESGPHAGEYLLPVDTLYASDATLAQSAISGAEFTAAIRALPARKVLVIFDCCHSGGIGQPKRAGSPAFKLGLPENYYERLRSGRGRVILASSRDTEVSWLLPGAANSLFTQHLLAGLRGGVASDDGLIRVFELFEYVQPRVTAAHKDQHPIFKAELEENFPVALYRGGQKGVVQRDEDGFRYDAYISFASRGPDAAWVHDALLPRLKRARLRVALSEDVLEPGVARVVGIERAIQQSKRTVIVLSEAYLADNMRDFENVLAQQMGINEGSCRLLPVHVAPLDESRLPLRIGMLASLDLSSPASARRNMLRLVEALRGPLPRR